MVPASPSELSVLVVMTAVTWTTSLSLASSTLSPEFTMRPKSNVATVFPADRTPPSPATNGELCTLLPTATTSWSTISMRSDVARSGTVTFMTMSLVPSLSVAVRRNTTSSPTATSSSPVCSPEPVSERLVEKITKSTDGLDWMTTESLPDAESERPDVSAPSCESNVTVAVFCTFTSSNPTSSVRSVSNVTTRLDAPWAKVTKVTSTSSPALLPVTMVPEAGTASVPATMSNLSPRTSARERSCASAVDAPVCAIVRVKDTVSPASPLPISATLVSESTAATTSASTDAAAPSDSSGPNVTSVAKVNVAPSTTAAAVVTRTTVRNVSVSAAVVPASAPVLTMSPKSNSTVSSNVSVSSSESTPGSVSDSVVDVIDEPMSCTVLETITNGGSPASVGKVKRTTMFCVPSRSVTTASSVNSSPATTSSTAVWNPGASEVESLESAMLTTKADAP